MSGHNDPSQMTGPTFYRVESREALDSHQDPRLSKTQDGEGWVTRRHTIALAVVIAV
jgi:hypothetical protein